MTSELLIIKINLCDVTIFIAYNIPLIYRVAVFVFEAGVLHDFDIVEVSPIGGNIAEA
jgi:hypothetical protein